MRFRSGLHTCVALVSALAAPCLAVDKNGVAPQAISLPAGPGSIQGLGESFQPQLNSGSGTYQVPLLLPKGPGGQKPSLALVYNSGSGNGSLGLGWSLSGAVSIRRNTDRGVPRYVDGPNGIDDDHDARVDNSEELDTYTGANGEELVPLADGTFRAENESGFVRYSRAGDGWEARSPDGGSMLFGLTAQARVEDGGRVVAWCLERQLDRHGNAIEFEYSADPVTPAQKYLRRVRWGQPAAYFAAVLHYSGGRPDVTVSYQSGYELRSSLRLEAIEVVSQGVPAPALAERGDFDGDGKNDALIRRYSLAYAAESHLSLLSQVTLLGADGRTSMPTLTFGYSRWTPPDNVSTALIRSRGAPPESFDSGSAELIDMNGDGLPDLLSTAGNQHRVAVNLGIDGDGRLAWAPPRPVGNAPPIDIASDRTHLADATADGLSDLMVKVSNTSFLCYDNTSHSSWASAPFPVRNTDTWPIWPYDGAGGKLSRSIDTDYSRSNDVLHTSSTGMQLWLLLADGRYARELRFPPPVCDGDTFRFDLPGAHIADLNGDRLQDLAWIQPSRVVYFPSRGRGELAAPVILSLARTLSAAEIERAGFSDVDGDGLVDVTLVRPSFEPNGVVYWLNRFERGLEPARAVRGLPALRAGDALRWADMNGNGTTDIAISQAQSAPGEKVVVIDLVPGGKIHLLTSVDNGLGLRIELEYESSTVQMVRAATAGAPWQSVMPVPVTVVASIVEDDGRGQRHEQRITYRDPHYDPVKQEFRGFSSADLLEAGDSTIPGKRSRQEFDTGKASACLKGKPLSEEVLAEDGTLFHRTETTWSQRVLATGIDAREVCFAFAAATDQLVHEGRPTPVRVRQEMTYDELGNVTSERSHGVVDQPGDELFIERTFETRLDTWLVRLVKTATRRDGSLRLVDDQRFFYDTGGNLVRSESWLDTGNRWIPVLRQTFDAFGNVIVTQDARGHRRTVTYDPLVHALPVSEVLHLGDRDLVMTASQDLGFGVATGTTDFHGQRMEYLHDALGRLVEDKRPGGAGSSYQYEFGNPVSRTTKRLKLDEQGGAFDSHTYSDCYGRVLATKIAAEDGRWRCVEVKRYNARKLESASWLPYASDTPAYEPPDDALPHDARSYDATGRPTRTRKPDGSIVRHEYSPLVIEVFDANDGGGGQPDVRTSDGLGRMVSVDERNGAETYRTTYAWTSLGQLAAVVDSLGNVRRFRFDSLGRLIESSDPDRGVRRYQHDDTGNLVQREDAAGQITLYEHDHANRLAVRTYQPLAPGSAGEVSYHYDAPAGVLDFGDGSQGIARNVLGRVAWIEDDTGDEHFSYDERGNIEWVLKRVRDSATGVLVPYRTQRLHDLLNREIEVVFPDNDRCRYVRNAGGFIDRIDGGPLGKVVLAAADYAPTGQPLSFELGNGVGSTFEYDESHRLAAIRARDAAGNDLLDEAIEYDVASNVVAIRDRRPSGAIPSSSPRRRSAQFVYDELDRLTQASYGDDGSLGRIDFVYDAGGNLLRQSSPAPGSPGHIADTAVTLGAIEYEGGRTGRDGRGPANAPGPHAITGTESGHRLAYDANGNLAALDGAAMRWDLDDRLIGYTRARVTAAYGRDHASRRVIKQVLRNGARSTTHYVDADFETHDGAPAKYVDIDGRRLARVEGRLDPGRDAVQRQVLATGWNLVSAAVAGTARLRDAYGADAAVYEALGASYAAVDLAAAVPFGKALWVHVPSPRLAVLRGTLPPAADRSSDGPLHAWPRLESFRPDVHAPAADRMWFYDAGSRRWSRRDTSLPAFLNDAPGALGAAAAFWSSTNARVLPPVAAAQALVHYHTDHLGSAVVITGESGELVEERSRYPYGGTRAVHEPEGGSGVSPGASDRGDFTGKERDRESGFVDMGARGYADFAGVFLSPDPRYADVAALAAGGAADQASFNAFLANPQMNNLYAYAVRNPLKFIDPSGLDITFSKALQESPVFQEALALFKATKEGQRLLARIEKSGAKVTVSAGRVYGTDRRTGNHGEVFGQATKEYNTKVTINVLLHKKLRVDKDALILELADTIHHELRHAEGNINRKDLAIARRNLDALGEAAKVMKLSPVTVPPRLRVGDEVHAGLDLHGDDPYNLEFRTQAALEQSKARGRQGTPAPATEPE